MKLTLLCNAGLSLETEHGMLLVDLPNESFPPFAALPEGTWHQILNREPPYHKVCGFWFTHAHPDHCDREKLRAYQRRWPEVPVFLPGWNHVRGRVEVGPFRISYQRMNHAPILDPPPHVISWIEAEGKSVYLAADAELNVEQHRAFIHGRTADAAFWNSMYLSRAETRALLRDASKQTYIYHMPTERPDADGLWRKLERNMERYGAELSNVKILDQIPAVIEL